MVVKLGPGPRVLCGRRELRALPAGPLGCSLAITTCGARVGICGSAAQNGSPGGRASIQKRTASPTKTAMNPMKARILSGRIGGNPYEREGRRANRIVRPIAASASSDAEATRGATGCVVAPRGRARRTWFYTGPSVPRYAFWYPRTDADVPPTTAPHQLRGALA